MANVSSPTSNVGLAGGREADGRLAADDEAVDDGVVVGRAVVEGAEEGVGGCARCEVAAGVERLAAGLGDAVMSDWKAEATEARGRG